MILPKEFNICIVKPDNYRYFEIFMDQALYYKYQFSKFGYETTIGYNILKKGVTNFVFGACLGFDSKLKKNYPCIFINLEQLGPNGAKNYSYEYMDLLRSSPVIDYDSVNVQYYAEPNTVPIAPILYAPYLTDFNPIPLNERKIDILFFGTMTPRREKIILQIVESGIYIEYIKTPTFGKEMFELIRNSKCVLNIHAYESSVFEQARASICLSLGTPFISERTEKTNPHIAYEKSIFWIENDSYEEFFHYYFKSNKFFDTCNKNFYNFKGFSDTRDYLFIIEFANSLLSISSNLDKKL